MLRIGDLINREILASGETRGDCSARVIGDRRTLHSIIHEDARLSPKSFVKLLKAFHIAREKPKLQLWLLAYLDSRLDVDGQLFLKDSGLLELVIPPPDMQAPQPELDVLAVTPKSLGHTVRARVTRTALLRSVCRAAEQRRGECSTRDAADAVGVSRDSARHGLQALLAAGLVVSIPVSKVAKGQAGLPPHKLQVSLWRPTEEGRAFDAAWGEKLAGHMEAYR